MLERIIGKVSGSNLDMSTWWWYNMGYVLKQVAIFYQLLKF